MRDACASASGSTEPAPVTSSLEAPELRGAPQCAGAPGTGTGGPQTAMGVPAATHTEPAMQSALDVQGKAQRPTDRLHRAKPQVPSP